MQTSRAMEPPTLQPRCHMMESLRTPQVNQRVRSPPRHRQLTVRYRPLALIKLLISPKHTVIDPIHSYLCRHLGFRSGATILQQRFSHYWSVVITSRTIRQCTMAHTTRPNASIPPAWSDRSKTRYEEALERMAGHRCGKSRCIRLSTWSPYPCK